MLIGQSKRLQGHVGRRIPKPENEIASGKPETLKENTSGNQTRRRWFGKAQAKPYKQWWVANPKPQNKQELAGKP